MEYLMGLFDQLETSVSVTKLKLSGRIEQRFEARVKVRVTTSDHWSWTS